MNEQVIDEERVGESLGADIFAQIELMKRLSAEREINRPIFIQEKKNRLNRNRAKSGPKMLVTGDRIAEFHVSTPESFDYAREEEYGARVNYDPDNAIS